jgi:phospholipid-transporting ATPase
VQLTKTSNIYFLFLVLLQITPEISNTYGQPITLIPLSIVIFCSAIKDLVEDLQRRYADSKLNSRKVLKADPSQADFVDEQWQHVKVGQVLKIRNRETFPADMVLIQASKNDCYVETSDLDGETNLKQKATHPVLQQMSTS